MSDRRQTRLSRRQVFASEHTPVTASRHLVNGNHFSHDHDFVEVAVMLEGQGMHRTIHGEQKIGPGDAFVLRPGAWHAYHDCRRLDIYNCCFGSELLQRELAWVAEEPLLDYLLRGGPLSSNERGVVRLRLSERSLEICRRNLDELSRMGCQSSPHVRVDRIGYLLLFLGELAHDTSLEHVTASQRLVQMPWSVTEGVRLLEENHAHPWSLAELADTLSIDRSYLVRLFKKSIGLPPMAYLTRHRAELAATLLLSTDRPVYDIGREVGWPDPNYFARRFKSHFGTSATTYRARLASPVTS